MKWRKSVEDRLNKLDRLVDWATVEKRLDLQRDSLAEAVSRLDELISQRDKEMEWCALHTHESRSSHAMGPGDYPPLYPSDTDKEPDDA